MYQQNPYSYGYGAYQQTYYPIANQGWNGNQQVSQQIPQRPMTFSQQSNLYEKVNGFEEVRSYHMPSGAQMLFVDANNPYLYTKSTDVSGRAEIHAFELKEISIDDIGQPNAILGFLTNEKISSLQAQNAALTAQLSQNAQTRTLIDTLRPTAVPAYITCSPYQSAYGFNGYNNCGCGCGCSV